MSSNIVESIHPLHWTARRRAGAVVLLAAIGFALVAIYCFAFDASDESNLRIALGLNGSQQPRAFVQFAQEARDHGLALQYVSAPTSEDALRMVSRGELDVAIVRGGIDREQSDICQIMLGGREVVHVFVREQQPHGPIAGTFRDRRVHLGEPRSEVHQVAIALLGFMGLEPGRDFTEVALPPSGTSLDSAEWPDVIVEVGPLLSPRGETWVRKYNYALAEMPLGDALHLRDRIWEAVEIPAMAYDATPAVPAETISTVSCRLVIVAGRHVDAAAVRTLLEVIFKSDFPRRLGLPPFDPAMIADTLEFPLHPGALAYLERDRPLWTVDLIQRLQKLYGAVGSFFCAALLLFSWWRRLRAPRAETYLLKLAQLELAALHTARDEGHVNASTYASLQKDLLDVRCELLEILARSSRRPDEQLSKLLPRVNEVQTSLDRLHAPLAKPNLRISA